ncbi:MAG: DUF2752 domain-containing protein [Acidimicrobiales bacterium]
MADAEAFELAPGRSIGPWFRGSWERQDPFPAASALAVGGAALAVVLAVAGLPPVDLHGPLHYAGIMDPLCGGTRATRLLALGRVADAWRYNPGMFALAAWGGWRLARMGVAAVTGRWPTVRVGWSPGSKILVVVMVAGLQVNQQLHAELLMSTAPVP